jgi:hypothetical protein
MQNPQDSTNPDLVNVADQGDGLTVVDQPVTVGPSTNPGPLVNAGDQGDDPLSVDQPVSVGPSQSSASSQEATSSPGESVEPGVTNAGTYSPQSPDTINTTQNTVVDQIYGQGTPQNVFV